MQLHQTQLRHPRVHSPLQAQTTVLSRHGIKQYYNRPKRYHVQTFASADVFALDFDGVLIDSEPEVTVSCSKAGAQSYMTSSMKFPAANPNFADSFFSYSSCC